MKPSATQMVPQCSLSASADQSWSYNNELCKDIDCAGWQGSEVKPVSGYTYMSGVWSHLFRRSSGRYDQKGDTEPRRSESVRFLLDWKINELVEPPSHETCLHTTEAFGRRCSGTALQTPHAWVRTLMAPCLTLCTTLVLNEGYIHYLPPLG